MIFFFIIQALIYIVSLFFAPFPTVEELPWGIDSFVSQGVSGFRYLMEFYPPFSTVLSAFILYLAYKLSILVLRFFMGSRTPTSH